MKPLLFGVHCHQPVDNFSFVVDEAIQKAYKPFFQTLQKYPHIKISVHFSGWLLEYIKENDNELFCLMQRLSDQIEFFTGGFYEPVLLSISSQDRVAQIKKLNRYIKKHFNQKPKGLWLTERVWDNVLIDDLAACGVEYVVLDDFHFTNSFYEKLDGYYITQSGENSLALFAISQKLRYEIPFASNEQVMQTLQNNEELNVIFDDGEKFGIWPKTFERVYENGWLESFFSALQKSDSLQAQTFHEFYTQNKPLGLAYLSPTSYKEMGLWSLQYDKAKEYKQLLQTFNDASFLKAGLWQNFFKKYGESNWLHKRMIKLSSRIKSKKAQELLFKAQCNDVFWHGVFGGIYLPNLRDNAYKYLIQLHTHLQPKVKEDIDFDGEDEYFLSMGNLLMFLHKNGGQIYELDLLDKSFNLQNTMTRYQEHYHDDIEVGFDKDDSTIHKDKLYVQKMPEFNYDWYYKKSSIEHFSDESFTLQSFEQNNFKEYGDFANQLFKSKSKTKSIKFERKGGIYVEQKYPGFLQKTFTMMPNGFKSAVSFETSYDKTLKHIHEYNLHFCDYAKLYFNGTTMQQNLHIVAKNLVITDAVLGKKLTFTFDKEIEIYITLLKTLTQSEKGVDETIQGISIAFIHEFSFKNRFNLSFIVSSL